MKNLKLALPFFLTIYIILMPLGTLALGGSDGAKIDENHILSEAQTKKVAQFAEKNMRAGKIPGMSISIVDKGDIVYKECFGYADIKALQPVTDNTLFELGRCSEAFVALGILTMDSDGIINLDESIIKYIPWLMPKYKGHDADIKISQLLNHTSGIPFKPAGGMSSAESTGINLDNPPGKKFEYSEMNYDILGLIIQNVSGKSFEEYVHSNVLKPLELNNTYINNNISRINTASGYKYSFGRLTSIQSYRDDVSGAFFLSDNDDISLWLKAQLNVYKADTALNKTFLEKLHTPDYKIRSIQDAPLYTAGFTVNSNDDDTIYCSGVTPGFNSYIEFSPKKQSGIAVLINRGGYGCEAAQQIGEGIADILDGESPGVTYTDSSVKIDRISLAVIIISSVLALLFIRLTAVSLIQVLKGERKPVRKGCRSLLGFVLSLLYIVGVLYSLYLIPAVQFRGLDWSFIAAWQPASVIFAVASVGFAVLMFYLNFLLVIFFEKPKDRPYITFAILSMVSGIGNTFVLYIVNQIIGTASGMSPGLLLYFVMGILTSVLGGMIVTKKMVAITNNLLYENRIKLIDKVLRSSYQKIETLEGGKIHAGLNNDTETISQLASILISAATNTVTLICCLVYLGILSFYGLMITILVILTTGCLFIYTKNIANRLWQQSRDIQNEFFRYINDIIGGFKELYVNFARRSEFEQGMRKSCVSYRNKRVEAENKFINASVVSELIYISAIASVAFAFPLIFPDMKPSTLSAYVIVFLYMGIPIRSVMYVIPRITEVRISWNRINDLIAELAAAEFGSGEEEQYILAQNPGIQLKDVEFRYNKEDLTDGFLVGPVNCEFHSGEITFITGGNGSGKSTLAKLITGLYVPDRGEILINGQKVDGRCLSQYFSVIYSDFYLFEKLYGIDYNQKDEEIRKYLRNLRIDNKLEVKDGIFSTTRLSTGQRKRLALLVNYLEDRAVFFFDEWAAEQDPEFRNYFYYNLLPDLKARGKCVIAITHDDRYFAIADNIVKMDMGEIVQTEKRSKLCNGVQT